MVEVILSAAVICVAGECHPALVGKHTPRGEFTLALLHVPQKAYRGDVLAFHTDASGVFAVHRPPSESRRNILTGAPDRDRRYVTDGCVNVSDELYDALRSCCNGERLVIR